MSAAEALQAASAAGVRIGIDGDDLMLEAEAAPPPALLSILARHKSEILNLLRPANDPWSMQDWWAWFDERAAIIEFDGGLSRREAEAGALACCATEWLGHQEPGSERGLAEALDALAAMGIGIAARPQPR